MTRALALALLLGWATPARAQLSAAGAPADAGVEAGLDAGPGAPPDGCGCQAGPTGPTLALLAALALRRRRATARC